MPHSKRQRFNSYSKQQPVGCIPLKHLDLLLNTEIWLTNEKNVQQANQNGLWFNDAVRFINPNTGRPGTFRDLLGMNSDITTNQKPVTNRQGKVIECFNEGRARPDAVVMVNDRLGGFY